MKRIANAGLTTLCLLCTALVLPGIAFAQDKPALAAEIRRIIDEQGIAAARQRFAEVYPSQKDAYSIDMQAMMMMGQDYIKAGDMQSGMAVMEMSSTLAQEMASQMYSSNPQSSAIMQEMAEQEKAARAIQAREQATIRDEEQRIEQKARDQARGKPRGDLQRFAGMYTDTNNANRTLFVTVSCDGYLVAGPMWADVGPWWMRSAADTVFTYSDSFTSFSMEFESDGVTMRHDLDGIGSPVRRSGPLPSDWSECMERPLR